VAIKLKSHFGSSSDQYIEHYQRSNRATSHYWLYFLPSDFI